LISKKISLKKRKAPLSTQEVYTGATQLAHEKTHKKLHTHNIQNPHETQNTKEAPNKHLRYNRNPPLNNQDTK
jgi:hypothetical protein